jgi:hypothetical protein
MLGGPSNMVSTLTTSKQHNVFETMIFVQLLEKFLNFYYYYYYYYYYYFNFNWAYARWQCYKNWTYIQEVDIHSKETKHTTHEKAAYLTKFHSTVQVQRTEYKIQ